jgi:hypothetical protein
MVQLPLVNEDNEFLGRWLRREALDNLESKYAPWLRDRGVPALILVARREECFTADDVWDELVNGFQATPSERRVLGCVFDEAARRGIIVKTGVFEKSRMPSCHRREKALWKSLLYNGVNRFEKVVLEPPIINGTGER